MKFRLALVLLAVAALAGGGLAYSAHSRSTSIVATVFGGGHHGPGCATGGDPSYELCFPAVGREFSLEATGLGIGSGRAVGTLNYGSRDGGGVPDISVAIHCLRGVGGQAVVGGIVTSADNPTLVGSGAVFYVADHGDVSSTTPDSISPLFTVDLTDPSSTFPGEPARFPNACPTSAASFMGYLDVAGDVSASG